jgi:hypothetical protein
MKRKINLKIHCQHPECKELKWHEFSSQKEMRKSYEYAHQDNWYCQRHNGTNLNLENLYKTDVTTLYAEKSKQYPKLDQLFWREDKKDDVGSGFRYGDIWNAYAFDFPEGTKLVVSTTVQIILPDK